VVALPPNPRPCDDGPAQWGGWAPSAPGLGAVLIASLTGSSQAIGTTLGLNHFAEAKKRKTNVKSTLLLATMGGLILLVAAWGGQWRRRHVAAAGRLWPFTGASYWFSDRIAINASVRFGTEPRVPEYYPVVREPARCRDPPAELYVSPSRSPRLRHRRNPSMPRSPRSPRHPTTLSWTRNIAPGGAGP